MIIFFVNFSGFYWHITERLSALHLTSGSRCCSYRRWSNSRRRRNIHILQEQTTWCVLRQLSCFFSSAHGLSGLMVLVLVSVFITGVNNGTLVRISAPPPYSLLHRHISVAIELDTNFAMLFLFSFGFRNRRDCHLWWQQHDGSLGEGDISVLKCELTSLAWPFVQSYRKCNAPVFEYWIGWLRDDSRRNWHLANFYEWD